MNRYPTAEEVVRHWSKYPRCLTTRLKMFCDQIQRAPESELRQTAEQLGHARKEAHAWLERITAYEQRLYQEIGKRDAASRQ